MTNLRKLRTLASCSMLGAVIAGCFGHHDDNVQYACAMAGSWIGGLLL